MERSVTPLDSFVESGRLYQLLDYYLSWHRIEGHTEVTVKDYRKNVGLFIRWLEASNHSLVLQDLSGFHVMAYLQFKKDQGRSPRYIRSIYQHLDTFFTWCVDYLEVIEVSPTAKIKAPKVPKQNKGFLKAEHFQALIDICATTRFLGSRRRSMLWILLTTGIRHMEMANLTKNDLDWESKGGLIRIRMGKGQKDRVVPFHKNAQREVFRYLAYRDDEYPTLWIKDDRTPLPYDGLGADMRKLMVRAGIRGEVKDTFHVFRRTWAANAERRGIPRQYILSVGGWEDVQMLDKYTRAMREEEEAVEAFKDFDPLDSSKHMG